MNKSWLSDFISSVKNFDGWSNVLTGLGTRAKDARTYECVEWNRMTETDIENLYAGDAIAAKIVDLPVEEATQKGYKITGLSQSQLSALTEQLKKLKFDEIICEAKKKSRLYGGAAVLKVYNDSLQTEKEVTEEGKKEIKALIVFQRFELFAYFEDVQKDMLSPDFGKPVLYTFIGRSGVMTAVTNIKIHRSRLVIFDGSFLPDKLRQTNQYWGDTIFGKIYESIRNYSHAHNSVNASLKDLSTAVFKIKNLADQLASNDNDAVINRMSIVNMTKSIARAVVIDAEGEDFDYKTRNLTGASDLVKQAESRLAAESSFPQTVLFGQSPTGGLGQSGDHESQNWYDYLEAFQKNGLKPQMMEIIKEVAQGIGIPSEKIDIDFNPLWQMSEKERTETRNKQAMTDDVYVSMGALDPSEVRKSRFGGDAYNSETVIDETLTPTPAYNEPVPPPGNQDPKKEETDPDGNTENS